MDEQAQFYLTLGTQGLVGLLIFNLSWIIPNLIFAYQGTECVTVIPDGFVMNLSTWLQVDAYLRIAVTSIAIIMILVGWYVYSQQASQKIIQIVAIMTIVMAIFTLIWAIVGSVMFWGKLNSAGLCTGGLQVYMFIFLIIQNSITATLCLIALYALVREIRINQYRYVALRN